MQYTHDDPMQTPDAAIDPLIPLRARLATTPGMAPADALRVLVASGYDRLPLPGHGATLDRWRALAAVGAHDLNLAKLFEGHTDALAILAEANRRAAPAGSLWGTWCAEPPDARLALDAAAGTFTLSGRKAWCSGARDATHAVFGTSHFRVLPFRIERWSICGSGRASPIAGSGCASAFSTAAANCGASSASSSSRPGSASMPSSACGETTMVLASDIASSTLFWMPRAMRSGATDSAACVT